MNTQFIIDLPTLVVAFSFYFSVKGLFYLLRYLCPEGNAHWHSGYLAGHSALASKVRPEVEQLVKNWEKIKIKLDGHNCPDSVNVTEANDRKVPGQE